MKNNKTNANEYVAALLLSACALIQPGLADQSVVNGYTWSYEVSGGKANITSISPEPTGAVTVPSAFGGNPVIGIRRLFYGRTGVTSVTLPNSLTSIGEYAFYGCVNLTNVTIPNSVTNIGGYAFRDCKVLKTVSMPSSLRTVGEYAFSYCTNLTSVSLPSNVKTIGQYAFAWCDNIQTVYLSSGVTTIESHAFYLCSSLTSINLPSTLSSIGESAFMYCSSLQSISIPGGVKEVPYDAFYGCRTMTTLSLSHGISEIGYNAFGFCTNLNEVILPGSITSISNFAFSSCKKITSINLPENVSYIGYNAFYYCSALTEFQVSSNNDHFKAIDGLLYSKVGEKLVACPNARTSVTIPEGVTTLGEAALAGCCDLRTISLPSTLTRICNNAFYACKGLLSISIPTGVSTIETDTFHSCESLTSITIPDSVLAIGDRAFSECSKLTSITLSSNLEHIGSYAFYKCSKLTNITIPDSVEKIDSGAFSGCNSLGNGIVIRNDCVLIVNGVCAESVVLPEGIRLIAGGAFSGKNTLKSLYIPDGVVAIGGAAFSQCDKLEEIRIPNDVISIEDSMFYGCNKLKTFQFPTAVTNIGRSAFNDCKALSSITIPSNVVNIGERAFWGCSGLLDASFETTQDETLEIGGYAFVGCSNLGVLKFDGNAPNCSDYVFMNTPAPIVYVKAGTSGWGEVPGVWNGLHTAYIRDEGGPYKEIANNIEWTFYVHSGSSMVTSVSTNTTDTIFVPSVLGARPVVAIGGYAFRDKRSPATVLISEGVTNIADYAFYGCDWLMGVSLPDGIANIGDYAFYACQSLTDITLGNSVGCIGEKAFYGCSCLTNATMGCNLTNIGERAFYGCNLASVTIPESVTSVGDYAFFSCDGLTRLMIGNNGLSTGSIGSYAFYACTNLMDVIIGGGIANIGDHVFYACDNLTNVMVECGVKSIGDYAFYGCDGLTDVVISDSVTSIGERAFYGCNNVTNMTVGDGLSNIGAYAFYGCDGLSNLSIGNGATGGGCIGSNAFFRCENLKSVIIGGSIANIGYEAFYACGGITNLTIGNGVRIVDGYAFYGCDGLTEITIPSSVTRIGSHAFYGCRNVELLVFDGNAPICEEYALGGRTRNIYVKQGTSGWGDVPGGWNGLQTAYVRTNGGPYKEVVNGEEWTFYVVNGYAELRNGCIRSDITGDLLVPSVLGGCRLKILAQNAISWTGVRSIVIPEGVTSIGYYSLSYNKSMTSVILPSSLTTIGQSAFVLCEALKELFIPKNVSSIGNEALASCAITNLSVAVDSPYLKVVGGVLMTKDNRRVICCPRDTPVSNVVLPDGVLEIGNHAFRDCSQISQITLPDTITNIESSAFLYCDGLTSVELPDLLLNLGSFAFYGCHNLSNIVFGTRLKEIGKSAFWNTAITMVSVPNSVVRINDDAFCACQSLYRIEIPASVRYLGDEVFYNCSALTAICFLGDAPEVGMNSFARTIATAYVNEGTSGWGTIPGTWNGLPTAFAHTDGGPYTEVINGIQWKFSISDGAATILRDVSYTNIAGSVNIPSILGGSIVATIGSSALYGCPNIISVTVPESVTRIANGAFKLCEKMTNIKLPSYLEYIGDDAFSWTGLTAIDIPEGVKRIGWYALSYNKQMLSVKLPTSLESIGDSAFIRDNALQSLHIPVAVTNIGDEALSCCPVLSNITVDVNNPALCVTNGMLFSKDGTELICCPGGLSIADIPDRVVRIRRNAFRECMKLTSLVIPEGVTDIGYMAICFCDNLAYVSLPNSLQNIPELIFNGGGSLSTLTKVEMPGHFTSAVLFGVRGAASITNVTIKTGATAIVDRGFENSSALVSVTIPMGVTNIGDYAFHNCSSLSSIVIPEGVTRIGDHAFDGCTSLVNITLPKSLKCIGTGAFANCSSLGTISLPVGFYDIGEAAFNGCTNLFNVVIRCAAPEGIENSQLFDYAEHVSCCRKHYAGYSMLFEEDKIVAYLDAMPPVLTPTDGTIFDGSATVNITSAEAGAVVHFTTNGTTPTVESPVFRRFRAYHHMTIRAVAIVDGLEPSAVVESTIAPGKCDAPIFSVPDGTVFSNANFQVSIMWDAENGELHYTTDGSEPTLDSQTYVTPLLFSNNVTIKAKVFGYDFFDSDMSTLTLVRVIPAVPTPSLGDGVVAEFTGAAQMVSLSCGCDGAIIRYTLDGSLPTGGSMVYSKPFRICENTVLKAYATYSDWYDSPVLVVAFNKKMHLGDYVEAPDQYFNVKTSGAWVIDQTTGAHGGNSIKSGMTEVNSVSEISTEVSGSGKVIFSWKTDTIEDVDLHDWNHVEFLVDGIEFDRLDGTTVDWKRVEQTINDDCNHVLTWRFVRYYDDSAEVQDCAWLDAFIWIPDNDNTVAAKIREVEVPNKWLYDFGLLNGRMPADAVNMPTGKKDAYGNTAYVWQDYIAGTDPTNEKSVFTSKIEIIDGMPVVTWEPDTPELRATRVYRTLGKKTLLDANWTDITDKDHSEYHFFRVTVDMP